MRRFRSRRFAMLLILMLTLSMALQGLGTVSFAEPEMEVVPPEGDPIMDLGTQEGGPEIQAEGVSGEDVEILAMGSIDTTDSGDHIVNFNVGYENKQDVYVRLQNFSSGWYYIRVTEPGGGQNPVILGSGSYYKSSNSSHNVNISLWNEVDKPGGGQGYNDTSNNGNEYNVDVSSSSSFAPGTIKSDNFKVKFTPNPLVEINKSVDPASAKPGETVTYTITVSNTGNVALTNVVVTDPMLGDLSGHTVASLAKGGSFHFDEDYTIPAGTAKASFPILNTATVNTAEGATDSDGASVAYEPTPHISLDKSVDKAAAKAGESLIYTFLVTNDGETNLSHLWLEDELFNPDLHLYIGSLTMGQSYSTTRSYTIPLGAEFPIVNTANVHNKDVRAEDSATVQRMLETGVALDKSVLPEYARPGETVVYSFKVDNIGETALTGVAVSDPMFDPDLLINIGDLASGASVTATHSFTIPMTFTSEDFPIYNLAVVNTDQQVSARDNANVYYKTIAAIDVDKTVSPTTALVGDTVTYTIVVKNTGDFTLYNVLVDDQDIPFTTTIDVLEPGASQTFNPTYIIQSGDVVDNQFINTVNVSGNTCREDTIKSATLQIECIPVSDSDDAIVSIGTTPNNPGEPGGGGTTTTTTVDRDRADPPSTSLPAEPVPLAAPVIQQPVTLPEEIIPLGVPVLPKTGELPVELFYGLGGMITALGAFLKRR